MFFDTHFHLNDNRYKKEDWIEIIDKCHKEGVVGLINVAADFDESKQILEMSLPFPYVYVGLGIHPSQANKVPNNYFEKMQELILCHPNKIVAIGECGLDFFYKNNPSVKIQEKIFRKHIELALKFDLPVIIHSRNAGDLTVKILQEYPQLKKIIHCFTYNVKYMKLFVKLGAYISFSGIITFKKTYDIQAAAKLVPLEKLLCETDAPWLAPVPFRGKDNYPYYVKFVYQKIEELRGEKIQNQVLKNVRKIFKLNDLHNCEK